MAYIARLELSCNIFNSLWHSSRLRERGAWPCIVNYSKIIIHECFFGNFLLSLFSCWMSESPYSNVLVAPVCLSMLLNLLFLCNIVRVVLLKLRAPAAVSNGPGSGPSRNILQAFRWVLHKIDIFIFLRLDYFVDCFELSFLV